MDIECGYCKNKFILDKMHIKREETKENPIRLLASTSYLTEAESASILNDCVELEKILVSIIKSSK